VNTWLLTPAPRGREDDVNALHATAGVPADRRVVVTTQPHPITGGVDANLLLFDRTEHNIAHWWNLGLDWIDAHTDGQPYEVLCAESDVRISASDVETLAQTLRHHDLAMVGADWFGTLAPGHVHINTTQAPVPQHLRLPGVALMVAGELGMRRDPDFRWWFNDDAAEWTARANGGTGLVGGTTLQHVGTTPLVGDLHTWSIEDGQKFIAKYGSMPLS